MNRSRVRQYVERVTAWRRRMEGLRNQPIIMIEREISVEEAKRLYNFDAHPDAIAVGVGYTVYEPLEVEVDPWPKG
ncbi:MAG: hypothetical protein WCA44_05845 [Acidobacteriaceae bacterium]